MSFLCARERSRSSLRFFSSVSRVVSRLNRRLVVSSAAQCVNYRAESLAMRTESRERGPALLTCTDEEGGTSCRRKNWGCFVEKSHLMCALALVLFCSRARPDGDSVWAYMLVTPFSQTTPLPPKFGRETQLSFTRRSLESHVRAGSRPICPRAPRRDCTIPSNHRSYMSVA